MRLVVVNRFGHRIGGIEVHLRDLLPALVNRGHAVTFLHSEPLPAGQECVTDPGVPRIDASTLDAGAVLERVRGAAPDLVYFHERVPLPWMRAIRDAWPSAWFAHAYAGLCVSGSKCWKRPVSRPCTRTLGWLCLLHYFPHGCGGNSPATMLRLFREQRALRDLLRRFDRIGAHSERMRQEFLRQGCGADRVEVLPFPVRGVPGSRHREPTRIAEGALRLLFLGRFDPAKGGQLLLGSLAGIARRLGRPVELVLAGEGPERSRWEREASSVSGSAPGVRVEFPGWLSGARRVEAMAAADLLVMPSVWPEPFGMTGIEAGFHGVPSVAFDLGGIRAWLEPGVNGELAPGTAPDAAGLVEAVVRVVQDPARYGRLCEGARRKAAGHAMGAHLDRLEGFLDRARETRRGAGPGVAQGAADA